MTATGGVLLVSNIRMWEILTGNTPVKPRFGASTPKAKHMTQDADVRPPRDRILTTARDMFHRCGIRGVGVDAIADAAGTNKMTLYRHFGSKTN